jgi:hypothetical protein
MSVPDWLSEDAISESEEEFRARGGALSPAGRQAAAAASLSLIGAYFSEGSQPLVSRAMIATEASDASVAAVVLAGIRLRVALAASERLLGLLRRIGHRPNFRYELRTTESVGGLSGQLDVNRWVAQIGAPREVLTFPTLESHRATETPENVLIAFAIGWMRSELEISLRRTSATPSSVESRAARAKDRELARIERQPAYASCRPAAARLRTTRSIADLASKVRRRAQRRELRNPTPYADLAHWIVQSLQGEPSVQPGDVQWDFYGEQFDTCLFELWSLHQLARRLAARLGVEEPLLSANWRGSGLTYTFQHFSGTIEIYYQTELATITGRDGRWRRDDMYALRSRPDIVARVTPSNQEAALVIVDPKLRQRTGMPTEEVYKLLGYFENFDIHPRRGAILFYTTDENNLRHYRLQAGSFDQVVAARLNPRLDSGGEGIELIVDIILGSLGIQYDDIPLEDGSHLTELTSASEQHVYRITRQLLTWAKTNEASIAPSINMLESLLGAARWGLLNPDVRTMLSTAVCVGNQLDPQADYSGPVLGLCSSIERLLHDQVAAVVLDSKPGFRSNLIMLGKLIEAVAVACDVPLPGTPAKWLPVHTELQTFIESSAHLSRQAIAALVPKWSEMNHDYRRHAAHRKSMSRAQWQAAVDLFFSQGLLTQTCDALLQPKLSLGDSF